MPNYILSWSPNKVVLRNYEGVITTYKEPEKYQSIECKNDCSKCGLHLQSVPIEKSAVWVEKLLGDSEEISLVPKDNLRQNSAKTPLR